MSNNNFNTADVAAQIIANLIDEQVVDSLKKLFTPEQINVIRTMFMYTALKNILSSYASGNNLYRKEIFDLKRYTLSMQDSEAIQKVSYFLQHPSTITAKEALDVVSKSELQYLLKQIVAKLDENKKSH